MAGSSGEGLQAEGPGFTGVPRAQQTASPQDPTAGLCLGPYGGPRGWAVSYERGTPVLSLISTRT